MHTCDALIVCCIDFRFQKFIREFTDRELAVKKFDLVGFAGSTKALETVMKQVDISVRLHDVKKIYFIHHEDCGAYGEENFPDSEHELERHSRDLLEAVGRVKEQYPKIKTKAFYLRLNGTFEKVVVPSSQLPPNRAKIG